MINKDKPTLFCDFDSTIVDSVTAYADAYSDIFRHHVDFKKPNPKQNYIWDLYDICPLIEEYNCDIFSKKSFFKYLKQFPNAIYSLFLLKDMYNIVVVSIGTPVNISLKSDWINANLGHTIDGFIGIASENCEADKSIINMAGTKNVRNIFIDDVHSNLESQSQTPYLDRYCYGIEKDWNKYWDGKRLSNWVEVMHELYHFNNLT